MARCGRGGGAGGGGARGGGPGGGWRRRPPPHRCILLDSEVPLRPSARKEHVHSLVDQYRGRCVAGKQGAAGEVGGLGSASDRAWKLRKRRVVQTRSGPARPPFELIPGRYADALVETPFAIDILIELLVHAHCFGGTEEQVAIRSQREVEYQEQSLLHLGLQIDQEIPARDEVQAGRGWGGP